MVYDRLARLNDNTIVSFNNYGIKLIDLNLNKIASFDKQIRTNRMKDMKDFSYKYNFF